MIVYDCHLDCILKPNDNNTAHVHQVFAIVASRGQFIGSNQHSQKHTIPYDPSSRLLSSKKRRNKKACFMASFKRDNFENEFFN